MMCPKCSNGDVSKTYHIHDFGAKGCSYNHFNRTDKEHLHYSCRECGYDWIGPVAGTEAMPLREPQP